MDKQAILERLKPIELPPLPENPLVSVLIANYNYGQFIGEAIESVLNQTYQNFEVIICDDGSTDNSLEVIGSYAQKDRRIKYIAKENGGVASALNAAYSEARGNIVCLLDADDRFLNTKLRLVVDAFIKNSRAGLVIHRMQIVHDNGNTIKYGAAIPLLTPFERGFIAHKLYMRGGLWRYMPASAICLRMEVANLIFPIEEVLFRTEADAYIYTVAPLFTHVDFTDEVLAYYRLHGRNVTGGGDFRPEGIRKNLATMERIIQGVNRALKRYRFPILDVGRNLYYLEQKFFLACISKETSFEERARKGFAVSKLCWGSDFYTPLQKLGAISIYWTALFLPRPLRVLYLQWVRSPNRLKAWIRSAKQLLSDLLSPANR